MTRPRKSGRKDFPTNLTKEADGRFRYQHPITGKRTAFGRDKRAAFIAANQLNGMLYQAPDLVKAVIQGGNVGEYITRWQTEVLPTLGLAANSVTQYISQCHGLTERVGHYRFADLTTKVIADALSDKTPSSHKLYLGRLRAIIDSAIGHGETDTNPADKVGAVNYVKKRKRLTWEAFKAVREATPPWYQTLMDAALLTLQREGDLVDMLKTDKRDGFLYVIQEKTIKCPTGYLKIKISPELEAVLKAARDNVISPYLFHKPQSRGKSPKQHFSYIPRTRVMDEFKAATAACGLFEGWEDGTVPTFHEIKSLGMRLLKKQEGVTPQQLAGHAGAGTSAIYLDNPDEIEWVETEARLHWPS